MKVIYRKSDNAVIDFCDNARELNTAYGILNIGKYQITGHEETLADIFALDKINQYNAVVDKFDDVITELNGKYEGLNLTSDDEYLEASIKMMTSEVDREDTLPIKQMYDLIEKLR